MAAFRLFPRRCVRRLLWGSTGLAAGAAAVGGCAAWALAPPRVSVCEQRAVSSPAAAADGMPRSRLDVRDIKCGMGELEAAEGMVVSVHCRMSIAATGVELERTRGSSGTGARMFGEPLTFVLGDPRETHVLGAVHIATVGMRVGGKREVRVAFHDPDYGYRTYPQDERGRRIALHPWTEVVVEVELEEIKSLSRPVLDVGQYMQRLTRWAENVWSERRR